MASGEVGGGHQNKYLPIGTIFQKDPPPQKKEPLDFNKKNRNSSTNWKDNPSWTAGTPITWEEGKIDEAEAMTKTFNGVEMLVSRKGTNPKIKVTDNDPITQYHPLITFYNKVLADICRNDATRNMLDNLDNKDKALELWQYLEGKYGPF